VCVVRQHSQVVITLLQSTQLLNGDLVA